MHRIATNNGVEQQTCTTHTLTGFPAEYGKPGDLNFICPGTEIAWNLSQNVRKPGQNSKFSRKPGMLRYAKI